MSCGWGAADYFHNMPITLRCANVFSYTKERPPIFIGLRMYKRRPFYVPNMQRQTIGIGSALPVHQMNYDKRQRQHFWFSFTNLAVRHSMFRSGWLLFRVKKGWLGTRGNIPDWHRVRKATFFHPMHKPGIIRHLLSYLMTRIVCFFVGIQRITCHRLIISEWLICRLCRLSTMDKALTFWF